jgi:tRNA(His) guanylyltransferase
MMSKKSELADQLGQRMKGYETRETGRSFLPYIPVMARLDGRGFSKFTKHAHRPFDDSISNAMDAVTKALVEQTNALIAYTQSDEISLVWQTTQPDEEIFFSAKVQKLCSVMAGLASSTFMKALLDDEDWCALQPNWIYATPHFDARVFQLPNEVEAANAFLWREADARKNAISMVAHAHFSAKQVHGKSGQQKIAMLKDRFRR